MIGGDERSLTDAWPGGFRPAGDTVPTIRRGCIPVSATLGLVALCVSTPRENWFWHKFRMLLVILSVRRRAVLGRVAVEGFAAVEFDLVGVG